MTIQVDYKNDSAVVRLLEGRVDVRSTDSIRMEVAAILEDHRGPLIIDLSEVQNIDSSGIGALAGIAKRMDEGQSYAIAGVNDAIRKVFAMTRLDQVLTVHKTVDDALRDVSKPDLD